MSSPAAGQDTASNADNKREQRDRSYQIDKQIEEDSKKYRKECKILLLGQYSLTSRLLRASSSPANSPRRLPLYMHSACIGSRRVGSSGRALVPDADTLSTLSPTQARVNLARVRWSSR